MKLSKRSIDGLAPRATRYFVWDKSLVGFGVRVEASGRVTFICRYQAGTVRRQYTLGRYGTLTPEQAREEARRVLGSAVLGKDPGKVRHEARGSPTVADLIGAYLLGHGPKLKPSTRTDYESGLTKHVLPTLGSLKAEGVTAMELNKLHLKLSDRPYRANRVLAYLGSVYGWGAKHGFVPKNFNPVADIERFREQGRERFLTSEELGRLGAVLRQAETEGLPWSINVTGPKSKHLAKVDNRNIVYPAHTIAAIRLLIVTGCRLREILNLRWDEVDFGRGLLFLADSKTGRKPVILNGAAIEILKGLDRVGDYVVAGQDPRKPRRDLKRPWDHIREAANLNDVRLHDLRHTHASIGASAGFGLQIVGKLLGHSSPLTTQRYAHLADDPVRRASEAIGRHLTEVMAPVPDALKER